MTAVKIMQQPAYYLDEPVPPSLPPGDTQTLGPAGEIPDGDRWHDLFDESDDLFHRVGSATTVAYAKVCDAFQRRGPPTAASHSESPALRFEDLQATECSGDEINEFVYPWLSDAAWDAWLRLEADSAFRKLYYIAYHERP
jgi:hypothetical protein